MRHPNYSGTFGKFAELTARSSGHPAAFVAAILVIVVWVLSGPLFHFSDTWQLVINTSTTIVTFLMVFLIQNSQNRDSAAIHIKLDELIRAVEGAHNSLLDLETLDEKQLQAVRSCYRKLAADARKTLSEGGSDTSIPAVNTTNY